MAGCQGAYHPAGSAAQSRLRSALHVPEAGHELDAPGGTSTRRQGVSADAQISESRPSRTGRGYVKRTEPEDLER